MTLSGLGLVAAVVILARVLVALRRAPEPRVSDAWLTERLRGRRD
jgi:hypothetical protein